MKKIYNLFKAELLKYICEFKSYFFNSISGIVVFYIIFMGMFYGVKHFAGANFTGDDLDSMIVGYILWSFALMAFQSISYSVYFEIQRGTMEQFYQTSVGIEYGLIIRIIIEFLFSFLFVAVVLILTMLTTQRWLNFNFFDVFWKLLISLPSLWGLALLFAGLSMIFKKIEAFMQIMTFGLIAVVSLNAYPISIISFLPFSAGATTIRNTIVKGVSYSLEWYFFVVGISLFYLILGVIIFKISEKQARKRNLLGQY